MDNELALLPASGSYSLTGPLLSRVAFAATNAAILKSNPELADVLKKAEEAMKARGGKGGEGRGKGKGEKPADAPAAK